jgi:hypothetical protein
MEASSILGVTWAYVKILANLQVTVNIFAANFKVDKLIWV